MAKNLFHRTLKSVRKGELCYKATTNLLSAQNASKTLITKPAIVSAEQSTSLFVENEVDEDWQTVNSVPQYKEAYKWNYNWCRNRKRWTTSRRKYTINIQIIYTTPEKALKFLDKIQACDQYYVEKRILKTNRHALFVIGIPESIFHTDCVASARALLWFLCQPL